MIDNSYLWIVIFGGFASFFAAMGIGANDVANAFATSVGSRALTIKQAVIIAAIFECLGAILMGSHVADTIRKGIADYQCFEDSPELLMYGCMCVMIAVGLWLFLASYYEMPVSTTHSCVGGMVGMTIAIKGGACVKWYSEKDTFPYVGGVSGIILSWFISPIMSALIAGFIFYITRLLVLRHKESFKRTFMAMPIFVGLTLLLNTFFIIYKGAKGLGLDKLDLPVVLGIAIGTGILSGLLVIPFISKMKKSIEEKFKICDDNENSISIEMPEINNEKNIEKNVTSSKDEIPNIGVKRKGKKPIKGVLKYLQKSLNYDLDKDITEDKRVNDIHIDAERFNDKTEEGFKYLQIFTAVCDSFSHGANDVANAIGPFAAIFLIWSNGEIKKKAEMEGDAYWILGLGGVGIIIGLVTYGYKIIRAIGIKICKITPSRGFAIELGTATVIIIGSRLGIPLSTTHCQIGGTMGVASLENIRKCSGLNCKIVGKSILGWILTLIFVGGTTALFVSMGIYAPSVIQSNCINNLVNNTV
tara:strand:- start:3305 stop:4894 length:1590 start_codon:yes stop_codon:yes gene_type:complete